MTYIVKDECIKCKLTDCVDVCPVDCFYEGENFLVINPDTFNPGGVTVGVGYIVLDSYCRTVLVEHVDQLVFDVVHKLMHID